MPLSQLIRPTMRAMRWGAPAGSTLPAAFVVWHFHNQPFTSASSSAFGLRVAALTLALGLAFVLDDPSEDTTAPAPISILTRRALRIALTLPPSLLYWLLLRAYASNGLPPGRGLPEWPFLIEVVAFAAVAFAGAALGARTISDKLGGPAGAGAVILVGLITALFPWGNGLLARIPGQPEYGGSIGWWWAIAAGSALVWWRTSSPPGLHFRIRRPRFGAATAPPADPTLP